MAAATQPTTPAPIWVVDEVPKGSNPPKAGKENESGVIIYVSNGKKKEEVGRVAYIRREEVAKQHKKPFEAVKAELVKTARLQANALNQLEAEKSQAAAAARPAREAVEREVKALASLGKLLDKINLDKLDGARAAAEVLRAMNAEDVSTHTFERTVKDFQKAVADAQKTLADIDAKIAAKLAEAKGDGTLW
jgi:uncharacterized protein YukE